jgi:integrase
MQAGDYGVSRRRGQRGSLDQLGNGRWLARYGEGGRHGRRHSRVFDTKQQGSDWLVAEIAKLDAPPPDARAVRLEAARGRTVDEAVEAFLSAHDAAPPTIKKLRQHLGQLSIRFGDRPVQSLEPHELRAWRMTISEGYRHCVFRTGRQMLAEIARWGWIELDPTGGLPNPKLHRGEVVPPPWEDVLTIADEIDQRYAALPIFAAGTGLRVEEWMAVERRDLDLDGRVVHVRRIRSSRRTVELGPKGSKSWRQRRHVPLRQVVIDALAAMPTRIDSQLLFPAPRGDYLDSMRFFTRYWTVAVEAVARGRRNANFGALRHASESRTES